jgi:hypothetical protein
VAPKEVFTKVDRDFMDALATPYLPEPLMGCFSGLPLPPPVALLRDAARTATILIDFFSDTALPPERPLTTTRECTSCHLHGKTINRII